jgi:hypothetical protein
VEVEHACTETHSSRLDTQIEQQGKEVSQLEGGIRGMHNDLSRLNALIAKNPGLQVPPSLLECLVVLLC